MHLVVGVAFDRLSICLVVYLFACPFVCLFTHSFVSSCLCICFCWRFFVPGRPPYGCPQQEWPNSVLLVPDQTLPLNENSSHHFNGFLRCFLAPPLPEFISIEKKRFYLTAVRTKTNTADTPLDCDRFMNLFFVVVFARPSFCLWIGLLSCLWRSWPGRCPGCSFCQFYC